MKVSVWTCIASSFDELQRHLTFEFNDDGDAIPTGFYRAFGIDWFDEDFLEASHGNTTTREIGELLQRHSEGSKISEALGAKRILNTPCNSSIVLYDFEYNGNVHRAQMADGTTFDFVGVVEV